MTLAATLRWRGARGLLLAALFYRALIPLGYMPALPSAMPSMHASGWLAWCPGGTYTHDGHGRLVEQQCFFGMAAAPTLPSMASPALPTPPPQPPAIPRAHPSLAIAITPRPPARAPPVLPPLDA